MYITYTTDSGRSYVIECWVEPSSALEYTAFTVCTADLPDDVDRPTLINYIMDVHAADLLLEYQIDAAEDRKRSAAGMDFFHYN